jgi:hypothetical protein
MSLSSFPGITGRDQPAENGWLLPEGSRRSRYAMAAFSGGMELFVKKIAESVGTSSSANLSEGPIPD